MKKILIVDDFATMRRIVKNVLRQLGYTEVEEAEDGGAALDKLRAEKVDLVIADWNMPNMSGIDMLRAIRAESGLKEIPVLMVTAEAKKENVIEAFEAGASNYIVKPFTASVLKEKIDAIFK